MLSIDVLFPPTSISRIARFVLLLCVVVFVFSLWFAPVSLSYLAASVLIGLLYTASLLAYYHFRTRRFAMLFFLLAILIVVIGGNISTDANFSLTLRLHYRFWLTLQYLACIFTLVFTVSLVLGSPRNARQHLLLVGVGLVVGGVSWYRWDMTRLLLPSHIANLVVDGDAPPGARKMSFTTSESSDAVLAFYRQGLGARGWQFTCSTSTPTCQSNVTVGNDPPHDVYHRASDRNQHGPTFEILIRPAGTPSTISVEVYDQDR